MLATFIICRLFCVLISLDGGPLHLPIIQAANTIIPYKKQTMQLYLIKETINTTNHTCYHSQRIQLNFLFGARDASRWKETFFIIFSTESSVAFVTRFTWDFSSPSSLLVLRCWLPLWFFVYFSLVGCFCYCYPARALRALGLLLAEGAPTVGRGKTLWRVN